MNGIEMLRNFYDVWSDSGNSISWVANKIADHIEAEVSAGTANDAIEQCTSEEMARALAQHFLEVLDGTDENYCPTCGQSWRRCATPSLNDDEFPCPLEWWPRFDDGERVEFGSAVDGLDSPCEKFIFTRSMGGVCQLQDAGGNMVNVLHGERVKRPGTEVLGADGLPIEVGDTVYGIGSEQDAYTVVSPRANDPKGRFSVECVDRAGWKCMVNPSILTHTPPDTQERIDEDVYKVADACKYFSSDGSCLKCRFASQYGDADSAYAACPGVDELERMVVLDLLRRQRELDARTMGGAK